MWPIDYEGSDMRPLYWPTQQNNPMCAKIISYAAEIKSINTHHKDTRISMENPNWVKNYGSELDQQLSTMNFAIIRNSDSSPNIPYLRTAITLSCFMLQRLHTVDYNKLNPALDSSNLLCKKMMLYKGCRRNYSLEKLFSTSLQITLEKYYLNNDL